MPAFAESEWTTRRQRIDPILTAAGWSVAPYALDRPLSALPLSAVTEYPTANGPADYALTFDGHVVGVVEAKRVTVGPAGVLTQAERYSRGVSDSPFDFRGCRVPFLYSTNGEVIHFHDARDQLSTSRRIRRFHTPAA